MFKKLAPVLIVDRIEPLLPLWTALGFTTTAEVPLGEGLGFVILARDGVEVMYQTVDSVRADEAKVLAGPRPLGAAAIFLEVDDLDTIAAQLPAGTDMVVTRRTTFYGSTETCFRDGAGNIITLAQFG
jgi:hypothetical protein